MGSSGRTSRRVRWFGALTLALGGAAFAAVFLAPGPGGTGAAGAQVAASLPEAARGGAERAVFPICSGSNRVTCVVDGDTIWYRGTKIRIADIDTPETFRPSCERERMIGERATRRLQELLNEGAFTLALPPSGRETDRYGRALRVVLRGGESLGQRLVREGLAMRWGGPRREWC
ncbi:thermonuclease family protein [Erythrobacter sp.]|uniref:thermonuclease family protein n=1 Tax=Erythrobacter sp. TaxID=1042 RepID=UPI0025BB88D5|nr:thermonuclease family protein [Erythrobacter sp.]